MVILTHSFGTQWIQVSKPLRTEVAEFKRPRCWQMHLSGSEGLSEGKIIANLDLSSLHSWRHCCFPFWIRQLTCSFSNLDHWVYLFFKMISFTEHRTGKLSSPSPLSSLHPPKSIRFSLRRKYYRKIFNLSVGETAAAAKSLQSCPTLCDPTDGSPPGSPIPGILQARTLEWAAISFSNAWKWKVKVKSLSRVRLLATSWTAAHYAPPSMGFSRQEYCEPPKMDVGFCVLPNCILVKKFFKKACVWQK